MVSLSKSEHLLVEFGIEKPEQIDLEAIAFALGAETQYEQMDGCEARIIGFKDKAIITVDDSTGEKRARFSLAHEIGHWQEHRGQILFCTKENIGGANSNTPVKERQADSYAAGLLMPRYMFAPMARDFEKPSFSSIDELANEFNASRRATAIRFVEMDVTPSMLLCYGPNGRKWFKRSLSWPEHWFPKAELDHDSDAFGLVYGKARENGRRSACPAETYFDRFDANRYEVWSHSVLSGPANNDGTREALTLLIPKSTEMMDDPSYSRG
ncbi:MAG: ImmA/IrrE family metallo-endopeptidase [Rhizobiaceae bacterium]